MQTLHHQYVVGLLPNTAVTDDEIDAMPDDELVFWAGLDHVQRTDKGHLTWLREDGDRR